MESEKDTILKRMSRGFKIMWSKLSAAYIKIRDSNYVQNMKAEQEKGLDPKKTNSKDSQEQFSFDIDLNNLANINKLDF